MTDAHLLDSLSRAIGYLVDGVGAELDGTENNLVAAQKVVRAARSNPVGAWEGGGGRPFLPEGYIDEQGTIEDNITMWRMSQPSERTRQRQWNHAERR